MKSLFLPLAFAFAVGNAAAQVVFQSDFDGSMPSEVAPGTATLTGVQGYAGLGPVGDRFGGTFLRSETGNVVTLTLTNLPPHDVLSLDLLFAAIDSLDGAGTYPAGDYFKITLDGNVVFREAFANASPSQIQTYVPPPGVELARHVDLGFSGPGGYYTDSAYWLGGDPLFRLLGHTAATATIQFTMEGPGIQSLADESWAMDNLTVTAGFGTDPIAANYGLSCGPQLRATSAPRIGTLVGLQQTALPSNAALVYGAIGLSNASYGGTVLPLPLDGYGAPGCWLLQDLGLLTMLPFPTAGGAANGAIAIVNDPIYIGVQFFVQGWVIAPGSNAAGVVFSNGVRLRIGQ